MKRNFMFLWMTLLMITMQSLCTTASAQDKTFKAICCEVGKYTYTLYFVYDTQSYTAGGTFTPEGESTALTIKEVYTTPRTADSDQWGAPVSWDLIALMTVNFQPSFADYRPTSLAYWFSGFTWLDTIEGISNLNTSSVTDMSYMFRNCHSLKSIDLSHFDTSNVTDMSYMFHKCSGLTSLDLRSWNVSNVTDMSNMFKECEELTSLVVSGWNTSNVTDMSHMFEDCKGFTTLDLSSFDTENVTNMEGMFRISSIPTYSSQPNLTTLNLSSFNTEKVTNMKEMFKYQQNLSSLNVSSFSTPELTDMSEMFYDCCSLTELVLSSFNTGNVTTMSNLFYNCSKLTALNLSSFDTSSVTDMSFMFYYCSGLTSLDVSHFKTSNVTDMNNMFNYCLNLTNLDVSKFNTSNVTNMNSMFYNCQKLPSTSLDVSKWNTSSVTDMGGMFGNCQKLTTIDVSSWDISNVTNMGGMFSDCWKLSSLDVSSWDTSNVTNMSSMFSWCWVLPSIDVSHFVTSNVTNMGSMFERCEKLPSLDVSSWDTSNVTNMGSMFKQCDILSSLDVSNFVTSNVTNMAGMFQECTQLTSIDVSKWNTSKVTTMSQMFDMGTTFESKLTSLDVSNFNTSNVTNMRYMFNACSNLTSLDVSKWNTSKVTIMLGMFHSCENLTSLDLSSFNTSNVTDMAGMFGQCANLTSLTFPATFSMDKVSPTDYKKRNGMFFGDVKLRYIDFSASNDADAITTIDRGNDKMFDNVPITTVIYLPHGGATKPSGDDLRNVVYTSDSELRCDYYYSKDKTGTGYNSFYNEIELPYSFQTNRAEYNRDMVQTTLYGTCILPYDFNSNDEVQCYVLTQEHPKTMYFEEAATVQAHTPFLFAKKNKTATSIAFIKEDTSGKFGITVNQTRDTSIPAPALEDMPVGKTAADYGPYTHNYDVKAEETTQIWTTKGYYVNEEIPADNGTFYIAQDKFWKATTETTIPPHRATFCGAWYYPESQGAPSFSIMIADHNGGATRISALDIDREDAAPEYYDASGRRHNEPQPGLNIVRKADGTVVKMMRK